MPGADGLLCIGLLEDDADFREELALGLGGYGFRVAFACDNAAAFYRRLQEQPCDIVILDAHLPGEDGFLGRDPLAGAQSGWHRHADRPQRAGGSRARPGGRRRRVHDQAGRPARTELGDPQPGAPHAAGQAPRPADAETRTPAESSWSLQDGGWILVAPDGASLHLSAQERTFLMALMDAAGSAVGRQALAELFLPSGRVRVASHRRAGQSPARQGAERRPEAARVVCARTGLRVRGLSAASAGRVRRRAVIPAG